MVLPDLCMVMVHMVPVHLAFYKFVVNSWRREEESEDDDVAAIGEEKEEEGGLTLFSLPIYYTQSPTEMLLTQEIGFKLK